MFVCFVCSENFKASKSLTAHIKFAHTDPKLVRSLYCKQPGCTRNFDRMRSFEKHLASHEVNKMELRKCNGSNVEIGQSKTADIINANAPSIHSAYRSLDITESEEIGVDEVDFEIFQKSLSNSVIQFLAKLYDHNTLTRSQVQFIVDSHRDLLAGGYLQILKRKVMKVLSENKNIRESVENVEIEKMFEACENLYNGLETEHQRFSIFQESGAYVSPKPFVIGTSLEVKNKKGGSIESTPVEWKGQFIPMRQMLKGFLEIPGVFSQIVTYKNSLEESDGGELQNIIQGRLWKEDIKPLFGDKLVLPLEVYFDEFETGKELGSHAGVHKLGAVYYSISCLPPEFKSKLENIFTALLFHSYDRGFGTFDVFRPVVDELKYLESTGITVVTSSGEYKVFFAMCLFLGDNLGVHMALGYVESFAANFFCRKCKESRQVTQKQTVANALALRDYDNYIKDVYENNVSATGIKDQCIWDVLLSFKACKNVCFDIMHDLYEGAFNYDMRLIILLLISRGRFTYNELNSRVQGFDYGPCEFGNKPPVITEEKLKKGKIPFSASEMLCFLRHFGLIMGHLIKDHDKDVWNFYIVILQILEIITSPVLNIADGPLLANLISEHHSIYLSLFRDETLKPKHHFMLHYHEVLTEIGPLERVSVIRYEGKHKEMRQASNVTASRKNIAHTLAIKAQLKCCSRLLAQRGLEKHLELSPGDLVIVHHLDDYLNFKHELPSTIEKLNIVQWVKISGTLYKVDMVLVPKLSNEYPVFGRIKFITVNSAGEVWYMLKLFLTVCFNNHYHAYEVTNCDQYMYIQFNDLITHFPTHVRNISGAKYITFRYRI